MGWEKRGSGQYYYRKKRVNGRVVSEYMGTGILAEATQMLDQMESENKRMQEQKAKDEQEQDAAIDQAIDQNLESIGELIGSVLSDWGYRKVKGEWRKTRTNPKSGTV